jgi:purine-nucleoside/S-methyl-5'-thioadenosine phosphorylase / adenosine deaminase
VKTFDVALPGARVVFSTRHGGVSDPPYDTLNLGILTGDDRESVVENRRRLAERVGVPPERVAMGWQVHGAEVREWTEPVASRFADPDADLERVDGHVTTAEGLALLVLVADCLPVAISNGNTAAMLHCGWRGLAGGIVETAVRGRFDDPPVAAIGPGIGPCCYEVGPEVLEHFDADLADGRMLDLRAAATRRLERAGVMWVEHVDLCTSCNPDLFFSHRRDGPETGRQAGVVVREE